MIIVHGFWFLGEEGDNHLPRMGTEEKQTHGEASRLWPAGLVAPGLEL